MRRTVQKHRQILVRAPGAVPGLPARRNRCSGQLTALLGAMASVEGPAGRLCVMPGNAGSARDLQGEASVDLAVVWT